jgi:hypothetical protein
VSDLGAWLIPRPPAPPPTMTIRCGAVCAFGAMLFIKITLRFKKRRFNVKFWA